MEKLSNIKNDSISVNYFLNSAAYSGLFSLFSVILTGQVSATSSLYVGLALGILSLFSRGSTIFIGNLIERSSTLSLTETGFGFIVLSLLLLQSAMKSFVGFLFLDLALLGLGLSLVNFALRGHILATVKDKKSQATLFSLVTMTANLGSAIGPLASNYIYKSFGQTLFFIVIIGLYVFSALLAPIVLAHHVFIRSEESSKQNTSSIVKTIKDSVKSSGTILAILAVFVGSIMNGQLFAGMALEFYSLSDSPVIRGLFYSIDALSVIALQMPVSKFISRGMTNGHNATSFIIKSLGVYGISFAIFACGVSSYWWICIVSLIVISIAECIYAPLINIALVEVQPDKPLVDILNYRLIIAAIGESVGSFLGGWIVPALRPAGMTPWYWCTLALVGIMPAIAANQIDKHGKRAICH